MVFKELEDPRIVLFESNGDNGGDEDNQNVDPEDGPRDQQGTTDSEVDDDEVDGGVPDRSGDLAGAVSNVIAVGNHQPRSLIVPRDGERPPRRDGAAQRRQQERRTVARRAARQTRKGFQGHVLSLKKGRRSRRRYDDERDLFGYLGEDVDLDQAPDGRDILPEGTRSRFLALLENGGELLERFVRGGGVEEEWPEKSQIGAESGSDEADGGAPKDPEYLFLAISHHLRQALKKHLPLGMLDGVESQIRTFFSANPRAEFVSSDMSSYERLLAHAASKYNRLISRSVDEKGQRTLRIENPNESFYPIDPSLHEYISHRRHQDDRGSL